MNLVDPGWQFQDGVIELNNLAPVPPQVAQTNIMDMWIGPDYPLEVFAFPLLPTQKARVTVYVHGAFFEQAEVTRDVCPIIELPRHADTTYHIEVMTVYW